MWRADEGDKKSGGLQRHETQAGILERFKGAVRMMRVAGRLYGTGVQTRRYMSKANEGPEQAGRWMGITRRQAGE